MRALADELLVVCAAALGLERDFFIGHTGHATHTMNINWYPPVAVAGEPEPGQFRIGPHTDFGTVTILDREPGRGGLQVGTEQTAGKTRPTNLVPLPSTPATCSPAGAVGRWKSNRHRAPPPQAEAPDEDLVSLVYFYEADHDAVIEALKPPIGRPNYLTHRSCRRSSSRSASTRSPSASRCRRWVAVHPGRTRPSLPLSVPRHRRTGPCKDQ